MHERQDTRIDVEAVRALVRWKSLFAEEVAAHAKRLASESSEPGRVTLSHYRQAAQIAVHSLRGAIVNAGRNSDDNKVA